MQCGAQFQSLCKGNLRAEESGKGGIEEQGATVKVQVRKDRARPASGDSGLHPQ